MVKFIVGKEEDKNRPKLYIYPSIVVLLNSKKVKLHVYGSPDILIGSADFTLITPSYWNTLLQSHLSGEDAAHFLQLKPFTQYQF